MTAKKRTRAWAVTDGVVRVGTDPGDVSSLDAAHEALVAVRPSASATVAVWVRYFEMCARVYGEVSHVDKFHHHEILYHASCMRDRARELRKITDQGKPAMVGVFDFNTLAGQ